MPFYRKPRNFIPLAILAERKSIKNGAHHSIFTSRVDRYIGDWKDDLKEGEIFITLNRLTPFYNFVNRILGLFAYLL